jgi:hypothetical protein
MFYIPDKISKNDRPTPMCRIGFHDTVAIPEIACNFNSIPEQILNRIRQIKRKKSTQHALAGDGSTGGNKSRRQPRFPRKTAEEKGI